MGVQLPRQHVQADLAEAQVATVGGHDLADHDGVAHCGVGIGRLAEAPHHVHDPLCRGLVKAGAGPGNQQFRRPVEVADVNGDHAVHQRLLAGVHAGVLGGVAGEDGPEFGMDAQVAFFALDGGQDQDTLLQDGQEDVVGLGPRAAELVVDEGVALLAGQGEPGVHPAVVHSVLGLHHRVNEVINDPLAAVAVLAADEVRGGELIVAYQEHHRPADALGQLEGQGGLAAAGGPAEVDGEAALGVGHRPVQDAAHEGGLDEVSTLQSLQARRASRRHRRARRLRFLCHLLCLQVAERSFLGVSSPGRLRSNGRHSPLLIFLTSTFHALRFTFAQENGGPCHWQQWAWSGDLAQRSPSAGSSHSPALHQFIQTRFLACATHSSTLASLPKPPSFSRSAAGETSAN